MAIFIKNIPLPSKRKETLEDTDSLLLDENGDPAPWRDTEREIRSVGFALRITPRLKAQLDFVSRYSTARSANEWINLKLAEILEAEANQLWTDFYADMVDVSKPPYENNKTD